MERYQTCLNFIERGFGNVEDIKKRLNDGDTDRQIAALLKISPPSWCIKKRSIFRRIWDYTETMKDAIERVASVRQYEAEEMRESLRLVVISSFSSIDEEFLTALEKRFPLEYLMDVFAETENNYGIKERLGLSIPEIKHIRRNFTLLYRRIRDQHQRNTLILPKQQRA